MSHCTAPGLKRLVLSVLWFVRRRAVTTPAHVGVCSMQQQWRRRAAGMPPVAAGRK